MVNKIFLKRILLHSGEYVDVADGITAVVGPNNTGKSSLLRELRDLLSTETHGRRAVSCKVIRSPMLEFNGTADGLFEDLVRVYGVREPGQYNYGQLVNEHILLSGSPLERSDVARHWESQEGLGGRLGQYYVRYLDAEGRLGLTGSVGSFDTYKEAPSAPLHLLFSNRSMESKLDALATSAFRTGIIVNRYAGSMINLHAGKVSAQEGPSPQSEEYLSEINNLALVQEQGDGMRAFVGMVMSIITGQSPLVLIDEPEAFLHPPQARMFGKFLADYARESNHVQVIIATHSEDVLAGLTSNPSEGASISIARLTREGDQNHVAQLSTETVRELYEDPLMKHYDMLNGLFTTGVVLCEADSDCTYYRAAVESLPSSDYGYIQEAHFTHSSGKARIAQAMRTFRETAVPVAAIFDIDILQDDGDFSRLIDTIGADKSTVDPLRNTVTSAVASRSQSLKRASVRAEITAILDKVDASELSSGDAKKVREAVAQKSGWKDLKTAGLPLLSGDAAAAFIKLRDHLEGFGVFILEQGELERLHQEVPQTNKAAWLRKVIEEQKYKTSPASSMLQRVSNFLEKAQTRVAVSN